MSFGIDYSAGNGLTTGQMQAAGVTFVCRYLAYLPNSKVINSAEFGNLTAAGLGVVLVWEQSGRDANRGYAGGQADAAEADRQARALGAAGAVIYFAPCDYDAPEADQPKINAYLDGAASVVGRARTGFYGGLHPLRRALDAGKATWGWQTYAWSGGEWDSRAHIQQYHNGARMGPAEVDYDRSMAADFGQWPRPDAPPVPPPPADEEDFEVPELKTGDQAETVLAFSGGSRHYIAFLNDAKRTGAHPPKLRIAAHSTDAATGYRVKTITLTASGKDTFVFAGAGGLVTDANGLTVVRVNPAEEADGNLVPVGFNLGT
jgi:hypothetical protein